MKKSEFGIYQEHGFKIYFNNRSSEVSTYRRESGRNASRYKFIFVMDILYSRY